MTDTPALSVVKTAFNARAEDCLVPLEAALGLARETPMRGVVVLTLSQEGTINVGVSCESALELVGAIEMMKAEVVRDEEF